MVGCSRLERLPKLKILADEFMREVRLLTEQGGRRDDVYEIEVSSFPLTALKREASEKGA
jgi:hypothetical protein